MEDIFKARSERILSIYREDQVEEMILEKANDLLEKGGKRAVIGERRMFGGRMYIKTTQGWKFYGKGGGKKAQEHSTSTSSNSSSHNKPQEVREGESIPENNTTSSTEQSTSQSEEKPKKRLEKKSDSKTQFLVDHYDKWIESYVSSGWGTDEKSKKLLTSNVKKFLKKDVESMNNSKDGKTQISSSDIDKATKIIADKILNKTIERYGERKHDWAETEEGKAEANKQQLEYSFYELLNDENNREASNDLYTSVAKVLQDNGVRLFYSFDFAKDMMDHDPAFKVGKGESRDDIYKHVRKEIIPRIEEMAGFAKEFEESLPQNYEDRYIPSINSYIHEEDERKKARKQQDKIMKDAFGISGKGDFRDSEEFKEIDKNWDGKNASELKKIFENKVNSVTKNKKYNELAVKDAVEVMMRDIVDRRSNQIKKDFFKKHPHKSFKK